MPELSTSSTIIIVMIGILAAIVIFSLLKGVIKMLLLAIAAVTAIAAWIFIQKNGFTLLALLTSSPQPWMVQALAWVAAIFIFSVFFHGMNCISFYHDRASATADSIPTLPWASRLQNALRKSPATSWILKFNPMDDQAQTKLACLVAYGCTLPDDQMEQFYHTCLEHSGIPHPSRFLELFRDQGLRTLVHEKRFVNLPSPPHSLLSRVIFH